MGQRPRQKAEFFSAQRGQQTSKMNIVMVVARQIHLVNYVLGEKGSREVIDPPTLGWQVARPSQGPAAGSHPPCRPGTHVSRGSRLSQICSIRAQPWPIHCGCCSQDSSSTYRCPTDTHQLGRPKPVQHSAVRTYCVGMTRSRRGAMIDESVHAARSDDPSREGPLRGQ